MAEEDLGESEARRHLALAAAEIGTSIWSPRKAGTEPGGRPNARACRARRRQAARSTSPKPWEDDPSRDHIGALRGGLVGRAVDPDDLPDGGPCGDEIRFVPGQSVRWVSITDADGIFEAWTQVPAARHRDAEGDRRPDHRGAEPTIDALTRSPGRACGKPTTGKASSWRCSATSCATRWPPSKAASSCCSRRRRGPSRAKPTLPIVAQQVAHMKRLIDDVLDLARLERGKLQVMLAPVGLDAALQTALKMTESLAQAKSSEVRYQPPESPIVLRADPERLVQVFANLLANALKFSSAGSPVEIWVEKEAMAVVHVRDYGRGIAPEDLTEIFEPFVQSKLSLGLPEGGLGLGLSVSRELVELHGGNIEAQSEGLNQGSTFVVSLPLP